MIRCTHLSADTAADFIALIPGCEPIEVCYKCKAALADRLKHARGVKFEEVEPNAPAPFIAEDDERPTLLTDYELGKIKELSRCSLRSGAFDAAFILTQSEVRRTLNAKGRAILALLLWRCRGQLPPFKAADKEYLTHNLQGKERSAFFRSWESRYK